MKFEFSGQRDTYQGKVRDVYYLQQNLLVMLASNRISAFDVILPRPIPFKGQVLNQIAVHMLLATRDICKNWFISAPAPQASIGHYCEPFKIEMVVRGNLTGHAWRTYQSGKRQLCGVALPNGMKENDFFERPIITPSTKASAGHDEDISKADIILQGLANEAEWEQLESYALALFERGKLLAAERGLILVDTKYEFGKLQDDIVLMDEIHTPDSSRYFYADGFEERQARGERQRQLSKEFVREWLIEQNFMGQAGQEPPAMTDEWIETISRRYTELYEILLGKPFIGENWSDEQTQQAIEAELANLYTA